MQDRFIRRLCTNPDSFEPRPLLARSICDLYCDLMHAHQPGSLIPTISIPTVKTILLSTPDRILQAKTLSDNYFTHPLDCSRADSLVVALAQGLYFQRQGRVEQLNESMTPTAVKFSVQDPHRLAAGLLNGRVGIWDLEKGLKIADKKHSYGRVGTISWIGSVLLAGGKNGQIKAYDLRTT